MRPDPLLLENQLCFPLYACSREIIRLYTPFLEELGLTYTQYIAMLALWEHHSMSVKELGTALYLDSGTLTPLLKKLEAQGLLKRERSAKDERVVIATLTSAGEALKQKAKAVPQEMASCIPLDAEEAKTLYALLYKILNSETCERGVKDGMECSRE